MSVSKEVTPFPMRESGESGESCGVPCFKPLSDARYRSAEDAGWKCGLKKLVKKRNPPHKTTHMGP